MAAIFLYVKWIMKAIESQSIESFGTVTFGLCALLCCDIWLRYIVIYWKSIALHSKLLIHEVLRQWGQDNMAAIQ